MYCACSQYVPQCVCACACARVRARVRACACVRAYACACACACVCVCVCLSTRNFLIFLNSLITIKTFLKLTDNNRSISYFVSFPIFYLLLKKNDFVLCTDNSNIMTMLIYP